MKKKNNQLSDIKNLVDKTLQKLEKNIIPPKDELKSLLKTIKRLHLEPSLQKELIFRTTLYSIGDAVITTDKKGKIQQMNPIAEKLCGWKESEAKNEPLERVFKIISEISGKTTQNAVSKVLKSGKIIGLANHTLLVSKNGKRIPIADSSAPIKDKDGEIIGVVLVFRDQTDERNYQNALEDRERKFSTLVSNLPGFVYRCANDHDWTMEFISEGCLQVTGYSAAEFINNNKIAFNDIIHSDYKKIIYKEWQRILKSKKYFEFEYPIISKQNKIKWVWERGRGVYSEGGKLLFLEGFITDITEKKESETRFKSLFEGSADAIFLADPKSGAILDANKVALDITGYTKEEITKLHQTQLHPKRFFRAK